MDQPLIRLENLNLYYNRGKPTELRALKDISLEIAKGEYVAFFGPSGCGKTTLLYTISGIEVGSSTEGGVLINGKDISKFTPKELAIYRQVGIGIVFQQFNLIPSLSVLDNVSLPMAFLGISLERRQEEAKRLLSRLGIEDLGERYPSELSGGQQQRVGIARALANNPPIIVADEPLGNLDSENANKVLEFLKELNEKDGRTIIMVTHEAWSLRDAKKIFYLKDGEIVKSEEASTKGGAAKSISSHVLKSLYPNISDNELIAKSVSHLLLRGYSDEEVKRFEFFLFQRLENKIDEDVFRGVLDKPFKNGGVGLWKPTAAKIARATGELVARKKEIEQAHMEIEKNPSAPLSHEAAVIRDWLLKDYKGKVSDEQKIRLDEIIAERIKNAISAEDFKKVLNLSRNKYGIGFSMRAAQRLFEKLGSVLEEDYSVLVK